MRKLHEEVIKTMLDNYLSTARIMGSLFDTHAVLHDLVEALNKPLPVQLFHPRSDERYFICEMDGVRCFTVYQHPVSGLLAVDFYEGLTNTAFLILHGLLANTIQTRTLEWHVETLGSKIKALTRHTETLQAMKDNPLLSLVTKP